jgi:hypothetical protein
MERMIGIAQQGEKILGWKLIKKNYGAEVSKT